MNYCKNCGNAVQDGLTFCPNCGTKMEVAPVAPQGQQYQQSSYQQPIYEDQQYSQPESEEFKPKPVSVGGYIGRFLISLIPFVGGLIYFIMLFIWSGDKSKEESFRNWAKSQLIITFITLGILIIGVIVSVVLSIVFTGTVTSLTNDIPRGVYY